MDKSAFQLEDVGRLELKTPTGKKTGIVWLIAGPSHPKRLAYENKAEKRLLHTLRKDGRAGLPDDPEELFDQVTDRLVAFVLGWQGDDEVYSAAKAREYLEDRSLTVRKQVLRAVDDDVVFTQSSSDA